MKLPTQTEDNAHLLLVLLGMVGIDPKEMASEPVQIYRTKAGCTIEWEKITDSEGGLVRTPMVSTFTVETKVQARGRRR